MWKSLKNMARHRKLLGNNAEDVGRLCLHQNAEMQLLQKPEDPLPAVRVPPRRLTITGL
jgi:hypothetical protein